MKQVLLINGSPAESSHTGILLKYIEKQFQDSFTTKFINLNDLQLPYNNPLYHKDALASDVEKVRQFAADVADSAIIVLGTPLYHGSFSGMIKVALDNLDGDAFDGKVVLISSNGSKPSGALQAAQELVIVCRTMGGDVYNRMIGSSKADYDETSQERTLVNEEIKERCSTIVGALASRLAS
jgi:azobenzene reductase